MKARSESLFHFTKSLDFLKGILQNGYQPRYGLEDTSLLGRHDYIGYPMVCFCDIPMSLFTPLFVISRMSSWAAHVIEQRRNNNLIRPVSEYIGPEAKAYLPIDER